MATQGTVSAVYGCLVWLYKLGFSIFLGYYRRLLVSVIIDQNAHTHYSESANVYTSTYKLPYTRGSLTLYAVVKLIATENHLPYYELLFSCINFARMLTRFNDRPTSTWNLFITGYCSRCCMEHSIIHCDALIKQLRSVGCVDSTNYEC